MVSKSTFASSILSLNEGDHIIKVKAIDKAGKETIETINVKVIDN